MNVQACQTSIDTRPVQPTEVKTLSWDEIITACAEARAKATESIFTLGYRGFQFISQVVESVALVGDSDEDVYYRNDSMKSARRVSSQWGCWTAIGWV
jgi:hypothetical protein